ncbi:MAG: DUF3857 domain-containing protein [Ferruginibacter sp.]|nr:DUF3857 domain-containing protein [Ferruginibacter sp.]
MKTFFLVLCFLLVSIISPAQDFLDYGVVTNNDLTLKQCSFDKDARAVVLLHEAFADYDDNHQLITVHHVRMKILKEEGFSEANITIPFYSKDGFEAIDRVEGMTINPANGANYITTKLEKKSIFTKKIDERRGEVIFTFPEIKVGSIIEYKYRSVMKHYGGLEDWDFQGHLPVITSKFHLVIIPTMEFAYRVNKTMDIDLAVTPDKEKGGIHFEMHNIPGLGNEPYMDARRDYLQKVIFQLSGVIQGGGGKTKYMTSWDEVTRELVQHSDFGGQLNKDISGTADFIKQVKLTLAPEDKMKAVFNYVRSNVKWNHLYSKYAIQGVRETWQKKSGPSGDINLLLVNLLKEAGLEAFPMLVSERFHGKVNPVYPFIDQFNSVFAAININNRKYYLDATDFNTPPHLTPNTILNTTAFVVNRKSGGLVNIANDTTKYKDDILVQINVQANAEVSGEVLMRSSDYSRMEKLKEFHADEKRFVRNNFSLQGTSITGKDLVASGADNDSLALELKLQLSGRLNTTGEYLMLPLNMFTGFESNPFISNERFSNINFGYPRLVKLNLFAQIPPEFVVDEMPKSVKLVNAEKDISFIRQIELDKETGAIRCLLMFEFKRSLYEADMYDVVKEMYQKLFGYLKEPVILKRKS